MVMATTTGHKGAAPDRLTTDEVWRDVDKTSFAVLGYVTPSGEPRSSGVMYKTLGRHMYVAVDPEGWKARHVALSGRVSVTVPVRRGGVMSLVAPIPPATVSFRGTAVVHRPGAARVHSLARALRSIMPTGSFGSSTVVEIIPEGMFVTYGLGVSLTKMRDPVASRARVPVAWDA
jgi:hypothetical protein